jgi:16S rRNA processing protein RimM
VLCRIDLDGKEAYIPLHSETLVKVDRKNARVFVELPEGLLDVYK